MKKLGFHRVLLGSPMKAKLPVALLGLTPTALVAQEKITFVDHVKPVLENKCFSCHNPDKKRGDLDLTSYQGAMAGGGGGLLVHSGDPDGSKLITTTTKKEEPFMPPEGAPLTEKEVEVLQAWINGGLLETASSIAKKSGPKVDLTLKVSATGKPEGPPAMPEHVLLEPVIVAPRATSVNTLAASPWAPLVAIGGNKQVLLYDTDRQNLVGIFPYPEGYLRSLKFSVNGALLIGGGGQGGKFGNAVVWDVKSGKRVTEIGKEFDQVTSADISPNQASVAIGSPSKRVKVYSTSTGEEQFVIKKHTEWVLSVKYSPDGILLASADRNGNVVVSEAATGAEFYALVSHKVACTDLAWRSDSNILASCGEDGKIFLYEMESGKVAKTWDAHPGGALGVAFTPDGRIVSVGRDRRIRTWDIQGKKLSESPVQGDIVTAVTALHDQKHVVSGDWLGQVKLWTLDKYEPKGELSQNPPAIQQRLAQAEQMAPQLQTKAEQLKKAIAAEKSQLEAKRKLVGEAQQALAAAKKRVAEHPALVNAKKAEVANSTKTLAERKAKPETPELVKAAEDTLKASQNALAALEREGSSKQAAIAPAEKKVVDTQAAVAAAEKALASKESELAQTLAAHQKTQELVIELKAAAFNVNLIAERTKLEALELDFASYKAALDENVQGAAADEKQLVEVTASVPKLESQAKALEASVAATAAESAAAQAELKPKVELEKSHESKMASANAAIEDSKKKITALSAEKKALQEAAAPKFTAFNKAKNEAALQVKPLQEQIQKLQAEAKALETPLVESKRLGEELKGQLQKVRAALAEVKDHADPAVAQALQAKKAEESQLAQKLQQNELKVKQLTDQIQRAKSAIDPLVARAKPGHAAWKKANDASVALKTQTDEKVKAIEAKGAELSRLIEAKKGEVTQAQQALQALVKAHEPVKQMTAAKVKAAADAKANHATAVAAHLAAVQKVEALKKAAPARASLLDEIRTELAKVEPQLAPLREKVKQMSEQYFAMLKK